MTGVTPVIRSLDLSRRSSGPAHRRASGLARGLARALVWALAGGLACQPATSSTPPEPAPSPARAAATKPPAPRTRAPEEVVATVDGEELREAEVAKLARAVGSGPGSEPPPREQLVLQLVERRLVTHAAARLGIATSDSEISSALTNVAAANGLTLEQLRAAVEESTQLSWDEYQQEVAAQLVEMRLVITTQSLSSASPWSARSAAADAAESQRTSAARARMVGCLRAGADVSVRDDAVELPDNPFAIAATLAGLRPTGDPKLPVADLEAAAKAVAAGKPLCDSLGAAEQAITQLYLERGYLDARVRIPWPEAPGTTIVDVEVVPGARHVIGTIEVDQSAAPKAKRVRDRDLRRRIAAVGQAGDVASASRLQGIVDAVEVALRDAGVGPVDVQVERTPKGDDVEVSVTVRARQGQA